jgi:hypothetical protein
MHSSDEMEEQKLSTVKLCESPTSILGETVTARNALDRLNALSIEFMYLSRSSAAQCAISFWRMMLNSGIRR